MSVKAYAWSILALVWVEGPCLHSIKCVEKTSEHTKWIFKSEFKSQPYNTCFILCYFKSAFNSCTCSTLALFAVRISLLWLFLEVLMDFIFLMFTNKLYSLIYPITLLLIWIPLIFIPAVSPYRDFWRTCSEYMLKSVGDSIRGLSLLHI